MENLEKIIIGIVLFAFTSTIAYLFRMRQLYAVVPKLYRNSSISKDGAICEIVVHNRGNHIEEDIRVELDPELKSELLASSSTSASLVGSQIKIDRLQKGGNVSAILLVENGIFSASKIASVTSKIATGRVLKKTSELPPNWAMLFLTFALIVAFVTSFVYGVANFDRLSDLYVRFQLNQVFKDGWSNLGGYYISDLKKSYSDQEFPVRFVSIQKDDKGRRTITFEAYNKSAIPLVIYADKTNKISGTVDISNFVSTNVPPMSKAAFTMPIPNPDSKSNISVISVDFKFGNEYLNDLLYSVNSQAKQN